MADLHTIERFVFYLASAMVDDDNARIRTINRLMNRKLHMCERLRVIDILPDCMIIVRDRRRAAVIDYVQRQMFG